MKVEVLNYFSVRPVVGLDCSDSPSLTKQADLASTDINVILEQYTRQGINPFELEPGGKYGDFSDSASYQEALDIVSKAMDQFSGLDARIRDRFGNDPARFLAFVDDPASGDELVRMGLAVVRPPTPSPADPDPVAVPSRRSKPVPDPADDA